MAIVLIYYSNHSKKWLIVNNSLIIFYFTFQMLHLVPVSVTPVISRRQAVLPTDIVPTIKMIGPLNVTVQDYPVIVRIS